MKMLVRGYVYWTNINKDIEEAVRHCRNCQEAAKMPKKTASNPVKRYRSQFCFHSTTCFTTTFY
ncbi:hypothetical protein NECAME_07113 [Necator americanus]|uniref:Integrase zinc-binding domain-containing protein n=1 Tax=Necator americanus TaxID=51031 RepID=W2TSK5_NECAM|nr:hypothetical protein NECAME_07113 [Necator americanus]ETN84017.1 hypothetical protein NECAME_07113 [Necator americanus]